MATESYQTQLERVQATIAKIETSGQAYEIAADGSQRKITRADLKTLYARETNLRTLARRENCGRRGFRVKRLIPS